MLKIALNNWVAKMAATLLNFGTVIVLSRNLGAENRGICAYYTVVIAFCLVINELAAGSTTVYLQQSVAWRQIRKLAAVWSFIASGVVCFIFWGVARFSAETMLLLWGVGMANGIVNIQYNILLGHRKYRMYNFLSTLTPFLILAGMLLLVFLKKSTPFHYLVTIGMAQVVVMVGGWMALEKLPASRMLSGGWKEVIKKSFGTGLPNQAGHVVSIINSRYVFYLLPATSLGVFTNALSLSESMLLVPGSLGQIYYSQAAAKRSMAGLQQRFSQVFKRFMMICISIMLVGLLAIWLVPDEFYSWLFGPQFSGVKSFLTILGAAMLLYSIYLLLSYFQSAAGRFELNLYAGLAGLVCNAGGILWLISQNNLTLVNVVYLMTAAYGMVTLVAILQFYFTNKRQGDTEIET